MEGFLDIKGQASRQCSEVSIPSQGCQHRRVLIIEDNNDLAESLRDVLLISDGDVKIEIANNGLAGVATAIQFQPDLVICDLGFPDMDGYQVVRSLREELALSDTTILVLTGHAGPEDVWRCANAGFDGLLAKPLTDEQVTNLLQWERWLNC
jgi:CheY-like chemotaxis protein